MRRRVTPVGKMAASNGSIPLLAAFVLAVVFVRIHPLLLISASLKPLLLPDVRTPARALV